MADLCTARQRCVGGSCALDPATAIVCPVLDDPCMEPTCDPLSGSCSFEDVCKCQPSENLLSCGESVSLSPFDPGLSQVLDGYPCASDLDASGAEHVFLFTATVSEPVLVSTESGSPSGIFVLASADAGCEPSQCVAAGVAGLSFVTTPGVTYAIVVEHDIEIGAEAVTFSLLCGVTGELSCTNGIDDDSNGAADCQDALCVGHEACPSAIETLCSDELDDDGDGLLDCDDPDCSMSNACLQGCQPAFNSPVGCGFSQDLTTGGGQSLSTNYDCPFSGPDAPGKEVVYPFKANTPKLVTATLSSSPGTGLYVLQNKGFGCTPKHCMQYGLGAVQFQALAGVDYYLVVDSVVDASVPFSIEVNCL